MYDGGLTLGGKGAALALYMWHVFLVCFPCARSACGVRALQHGVGRYGTLGGPDAGVLENVPLSWQTKSRPSAFV